MSACLIERTFFITKFIVPLDATYFPGRSADIYLTYLSPETYRRTTAKIGSLGVLHPEVLQNYELSYPTTVLEFNLEPLL
jgi:phenylalanyl-tRNA synthetase beta chain